MTDNKCKEIIESFDVSRNNMSGVTGTYYTDNREENLLNLVKELLEEMK